MEKTRRHIGILKHKAVGYAEELLIKIATARGLVASVVNPCDIAFGDDDEQFPDVVLARCELSSFSDGALSAYLAYFGECRRRGIHVVNPEKFLLSGQHKYFTHQALRNYLAEIGIADDINPPTWLTHDKDKAFAILLKEIGEFGSAVIKQPCSGRGEGVYLARDESEVAAIVSGHFADGDPILVQRTIQKETDEYGGYRDMRLWVCRDSETDRPQVVDGFYRNAPRGEFLTNINRGAYVSRMDNIDDKLAYYAGLVMDATHGDVAGLDFVRDTDGKYWFEEANVAFETSEKTIASVGAEIWSKAISLLQSRMDKSGLGAL